MIVLSILFAIFTAGTFVCLVPPEARILRAAAMSRSAFSPASSPMSRPPASRVASLAMKAVIAAFPVRTLYSSVTSSSNGAFQRVMRAAETANLAITVPNVGDTFSLGSATVTVLGPQKHYSDVNNQSLILRVDYGSNAFLFTGDAEYESETDVLDAGEDVRCDVIKAGHHGSRTSTGYRLLYEAQPKYAVISCGADNEYGHPHDDTLSRLRDADVIVYRTDLNGTIVCRSDGVNLTFTTEKEG